MATEETHITTRPMATEETHGKRSKTWDYENRITTNSSKTLVAIEP